jgi:Plasmid pRiA4b ORF-3-like protein
LSTRVDLIEGHGTGCGQGGSSWPRAATPFKQLAGAIYDAFARWDRSHLQDFTLADGRRLCDPDPDWELEGEVTEDYRRVKLSRPQPGEQFAYVVDLGDDWAHLCTVGARRIDPVEVLGILPDTRRCRIGAGATFPTSTGVAGTTTTVSRHRPRTWDSLTFHRSGHIGA